VERNDQRVERIIPLIVIMINRLLGLNNDEALVFGEWSEPLKPTSVEVLDPFIEWLRRQEFSDQL
jgi:hypothetical protein